MEHRALRKKDLLKRPKQSASQTMYVILRIIIRYTTDLTSLLPCLAVESQTLPLQ